MEGGRLRTALDLLAHGVWPGSARELEYLGNPPEREAALRAIMPRPSRLSAVLRVLATGLISYLGIPTVLGRLGAPIEPLRWSAPSFIAGSLGLFVTVLGVEWFCAWTTRRRTSRALRRYLPTIGIPVCMQCGYCLLGQTTLRCPECGKPSA